MQPEQPIGMGNQVSFSPPIQNSKNNEKQNNLIFIGPCVSVVILGLFIRPLAKPAQIMYTIEYESRNNTRIFG